MSPSEPGVVRDVVMTVSDPLPWVNVRTWMSARAISGIEVVDVAGYRRSALIGAVPARIDMTYCHDRSAVLLRVTTPEPVDVTAVVGRARRILGLDCDLAATRAALGRDPWMASLLARHVGLRVPGGWDPFELAVRAVLGQQITVGAARQLASQLVALCGAPLPTSLRAAGLATLFPTPERVAQADLSPLRMPGARRATLIALARAAAADDGVLDSGGSLDEAIARLRAVKGIGEWTAHYVALRALRHPDAFPASDIGLLRGAARERGARPTPAALRARAETWRPHRAYAAQVLWAEDEEAGRGRPALDSES